MTTRPGTPKDMGLEPKVESKGWGDPRLSAAVPLGLASKRESNRRRGGGGEGGGGIEPQRGSQSRHIASWASRLGLSVRFKDGDNEKELPPVVRSSLGRNGFVSPQERPAVGCSDSRGVHPHVAQAIELVA
ncbi:hypothetical protein CH63R_02560 [Colletotrichum higginsianum IMI 349063]|uniref:Uncharacterized protein n=1 Tax=Colletotrichum higginsianum (strain IMI 349063) TaxID=759273 RepID=A0A1B7YPF9_COLHI|nr:hypothetical protein CH63R_02560 [Colletotrichum higginsianum IMI 349063]OBR13834.1 hypothetical protein CH63R_02560 [Colletotrichum higginsianum IMI 349063]